MGMWERGYRQITRERRRYADMQGKHLRKITEEEEERQASEEVDILKYSR